MQHPALTAITLSLILGFVTGCSDKDTPQAQLISPNLPVIAMSDLVKNPALYTGKTVTVTGRFGGMCPDGADFYFKDKLDIIEVIPVAGLPADVVIGTPLKVQGVVLVRGEHEIEGKEERHEEGGEPESEVKIQATVIQANRS